MATKELTKEQLAQQMNICGWVCAFADLIGGIIRSFIGLFIPVEFFICLYDKKCVKDYMGISIPLGYCLITPLYLYQRAERLKESKTKFIISLIIFILGILGILFSFMTMQ